MQWIIKYLTSSIGKKQIMGCSGAAIALFILGHMVGNLQLINPDQYAAQAHYNAYTQLLTGMKPIIYFVEIGLVALFLIHVGLAIKLKLENKAARGSEGYDVNARKGQKTFATFTMIWSGLFILAFAVQHLATLKFGDHFYYLNDKGEVVRDMWLTTIDMFANPFWTGFYLISMFVIGMHLFHAIASAFQTLGLAHQKWTPIVEIVGVVYSVVVALGFAVEAGFACYTAHQPQTLKIREESHKKSDELKPLYEKQQAEKASKKIAFVVPASMDEVQVSYVVEGGR